MSIPAEKTETKEIVFQEQATVQVNTFPIFSPEEFSARRKELEQALYDIFKKYKSGSSGGKRKNLKKH